MVALLATVSIVACTIPAWRALRADPALERLDRVAALADRVRMASSAADALPAVRQLETTVRAVWLGNDADRDVTSHQLDPRVPTTLIHPPLASCVLQLFQILGYFRFLLGGGGGVLRG